MPRLDDCGYSLEGINHVLNDRGEQIPLGPGILDNSGAVHAGRWR